MRAVIKTAIRDARPFVEEQETFTAGSVFALNYETGYVVFSYGHHHPLFACVNRGGRRVWFVNEAKVSVTTSKHRTMLAPRGVHLHPMSCEAMRLLHRCIAGRDERGLASFATAYA